jgi:hypothetical protein
MGLNMYAYSLKAEALAEAPRQACHCFPALQKESTSWI